MTIGVIAGFSLLALASGFFLVKKGWTASSGGSSTSEILGKDDLNSILGIDDEYIYTPIGKLENSSVTDYPFDSDNPDFTGAKYIGDGWYLMANGLYFHKSSKTWSSTPPEKKKDSAALVGGGSGAVAGTIIGTGAEVVKNESKIKLLLIGAIVSIVVYFATKDK